jgi:urease accessory protein
LITVDTIIGNINKDKKLRKEFKMLCDKDSCEKIMVSRLESQRVRMRKITDKGTDVGLILPIGTILQNGDVIHKTKDKIIIIEIEPEDVAVLSFNSEDSHDFNLFGLAVRIGHTLGNMHRPIKVVGTSIYIPIQADTEIELLNRIFEPMNHHLHVTKDKIIFEPEEGTHTHEHR